MSNYDVIMEDKMLTKIVDIGNSKGIRIPHAVLKSLKITDQINLRIEHEKIILERVHNARSGWSSLFGKCSENFDGWNFNNSWDDTEWEW